MMAARILIVEDESRLAGSIQFELERVGYAVVGRAGSGEEALSLAAAAGPDLVLMDIQLSGKLDGITTAEQIRARQAIPVVFLAGDANDKTMKRAYAASPYGVVLKPFQPSDLRRMIEMALYQQAQDQELVISDATTTNGHCLGSGGPLNGEGGRPATVISSDRDISRQKLAEAALRQAHQKMHAILESISDAFLSLDSQLVVTYFNAAAEEALGRLRSDVIGRPLFEAFPEARGSIFEEKYTRALRDKVALYFETYFGIEPYANWYQVRVYPYADGISVYFQVITDRKQAEQDLRELNAQLEERIADRTAQLDAANEELSAVNQELNAVNMELAHAVRSRDEFLASMSHELRTPLTSILGLSEALQMSIYGPLTEKQVPALKTIRESGEHLLALITDILDLSKTSAGKLELQTAPVIVADVCQASLRLIAGQAQKKNIQLLHLINMAPGWMQVDERRLKQILVNLLGNAVKFTPEGGQIGLEVTGDAERGLARFVVWDTGIGIAPEVMPRLFKPFVQLDNKLNRDHSGTGLGLALVHQLVALHGGSISLESAGRPGEGSRFTVALPWNVRTEEEMPLPVEHRQTAGPLAAAPQRLAGAQILVADDNATTLEFLHDSLAAHGYAVTVAHNGVEALSRARALQPAVMVLDIQMPGLDGLEVMRQAREQPGLAAIPIIALTALAMPGDRERCLDAGADDYLAKPVSLTALLKKIDALVAAGQA